MTLNITVLTPRVIYQASDFRLSNPQNQKPEDMPSTKVVSLRYPEWAGFITYTGIGRVREKHTSDFVSEWFATHSKLSFEEAVEVLRESGTNWLKDYKIQHTFVLAAFIRSRPVVATISNYQQWNGPDQNTISPVMFSTQVHLKRGVKVIVTGLAQAVTRHQRTLLKHLAKTYPDNPALIRNTLSEINREASKVFPNLISEDSFVQSIDEHGRGKQTTFGQSRSAPHILMNGIDFTKKIQPFLDKQFGKNKWTTVQGTSTSSEDRSSAPLPCKIIPSSIETRQDYTLIPMALPQGNRACPKSINAKGIIVGEGTPLWNGASYPCAWLSPEKLIFLSHLGGLGGSANAINDFGIIVGASELPNRHTHACKWEVDSCVDSLTDIGSQLPSHSGAHAINDSGAICGWASIHPTEGGHTK